MKPLFNFRDKCGHVPFPALPTWTSPVREMRDGGFQFFSSLLAVLFIGGLFWHELAFTNDYITLL